MTMMDFNADQFKLEFDQVTNELALTEPQNSETSVKELLQAVHKSIDIMQRLDADIQAGKNDIEVQDISQIGDYMLSLLMALGDVAAHQGQSQNMLHLHRLSLPVAVWISQYKGEIKQLEIIVNAIATLANEIKKPRKLAEFAAVLEQIVAHVSADIRRDLEAANNMRPWLVLNMNWGIVATRSHDVDVMKRVFDALLKNIPVEAKQFFEEGMQQMQVVNYPAHVREVMQQYHQTLGGGVQPS